MNSDPALFISSNIVPILAAIINALIVAAARLSTSHNTPTRNAANKNDHYVG